MRTRRGLRKLRVLQDQADQWMADAYIRHPITCGRCEDPHCCNQVVAISLLEALHIVLWCDDHGRGDWLRSKRDQLEAEHRELSSPSMDRDQWYRDKRPCFALEAGSCTIYEGRPTPCRLHLAVSDPAVCDPDHANEGAFVNTAGFALHALKIEHGAAVESGLPFLHGPMQTMLCVALEYLDRGEQAMLDWLGPLRDPEAIAKAFEHIHHTPSELEKLRTEGL